jgi:MoaA/NifB/PqqE/SkfB family radical SAM enzyme
MNGIHFLLTYTCNFECDHCFLYCGPKSQGNGKKNKRKKRNSFKVLDNKMKLSN